MEAKRFTEQLTSDNAALLLIDHQVGLCTGVRDLPIAELKHNVIGLAKAAKALGLPTVVTATSPEMWGPTIPELVEALPRVSVINRTTVNAFDEARFSKAVEATGRKKLIIAGISLEVCAALPAMGALGNGYDTYVAVDACGTFSDAKRQMGVLRMRQAGVILSDFATLMVEILKDNAASKSREVYGALDMDWATVLFQMPRSKN
jgi:nicotinamidase-related amidase